MHQNQIRVSRNRRQSVSNARCARRSPGHHDHLRGRTMNCRFFGHILGRDHYHDPVTVGPSHADRVIEYSAIPDYFELLHRPEPTARTARNNDRPHHGRHGAHRSCRLNIRHVA